MSACPKCGGRLVRALDLEVDEVKCLNCGKRVFVRPLEAPIRRRAERPVGRPLRQEPVCRRSAAPIKEVVRRKRILTLEEREARQRAYMARPEVKARKRAYMAKYMRERRQKQTCLRKPMRTHAA